MVVGERATTPVGQGGEMVRCFFNYYTIKNYQTVLNRFIQGSVKLGFGGESWRVLRRVSVVRQRRGIGRRWGYFEELPTMEPGQM